MPRLKRVEFDGAIYHVIARGNRETHIFKDDTDRENFLATLHEAVQKTGWEVYAYALMDTHYHLAFRTPMPNLVSGMTWFQNTITKRFNARHKEHGHLFAGRYKALHVEEGSYLENLIHYIHAVPIRETNSTPGDLDSVKNCPYSSISQYGAHPSERPPCLSAAEGLRIFSLSDTPFGREALLDLSVQSSFTDEDEFLNSIKGGWIIGSTEFLKKLSGKLHITKADRSNGYGGAQMQMRDQQIAEDIIKEGLTHFELNTEQLSGLRKNDWRKANIAHEIRKQTVVKADWISEHLIMGNRSGISKAVSSFKQDVESGELLRDLIYTFTPEPSPISETPAELPEASEPFIEDKLATNLL